MPEQSPSQLINDWQTAAKDKDAKTLQNFYTDKAVLCATEGIISDSPTYQATSQRNLGSAGP